MLAISVMDKRGTGDIIRIAVDKSAKYESDEIWYQEKLYDVMKRESINDTNYLYLLQDKEEEKLLSANSEYFNNLTALSLGDNSKIPHIAKFIVLPEFKYFFAKEQKISPFLFKIGSLNVKYKFKIKQIPADVPTPPPKS